MKKRTFICITALLLIPMVSCNKDALPQRQEFPTIRTLEVESIDSSEVLLKGRLVNAGIEEVEELGFVFDTSEPVIERSDTVRISPVSSGDAFSLKIDHSFAGNVEYNVRAFANTESYTIYGNKIIYPSSGTRWNPWSLRISRKKIENYSVSQESYAMGKGYILFRSGALYEFDPNSYTFTNRITFPRVGYLPQRFSIFSINNFLFVVFLDNRDIYKYDIDNDVWEIIENSDVYFGANPEGFRSDRIDSFSINGTGYVIARNYFYSFDYSTNTWSYLGYFPSKIVSTVSNNKDIYILSVDNEFWKYDIENNAWIPEANYPTTYFVELTPNSTSGLNTFSIGEKLYFGSETDQDNRVYLQEIWEYSPSTRTWREITKFPVTYRLRLSFSFATESKAFLGFFDRTSRENDNWFDIWEFDSSKIRRP